MRLNSNFLVNTPHSADITNLFPFLFVSLEPNHAKLFSFSFLVTIDVNATEGKR